MSNDIDLNISDIKTKTTIIPHIKPITIPNNDDNDDDNNNDKLNVISPLSEDDIDIDSIPLQPRRQTGLSNRDATLINSLAMQHATSTKITQKTMKTDVSSTLTSPHID